MKLLVIADDFTGALDTGVQFAKAGAHTCVLADTAHDLSALSTDVQVLIIDTESRHLPPEDASRTVAEAIKSAREAGFDAIYYKKTDSGLRGNIGAELSALLRQTGQQALCFIPAFPKIGRTTRAGIQYIDGVPVAETVFGKDPFEPVRHSSIARIISEQSDVCTQIVPAGEMPRHTPGQPPTIYIFDAETDEDLRAIAARVYGDGICLLAGCAGFAEYLPRLLGTKPAEARTYTPPGNMIVISGSVNPITLAQLKYARAHGFACVTLTAEQKLTRGYAQTDACERFLDEAIAAYRENGRLILEAVDSTHDTPRVSGDDGPQDLARQQVLENIGGIVKRLYAREPDSVFVFIGGDTLIASMRHAGVTRIEPIDEIAPGVVFSAASNESGTRFVVTKSGGFGGEDIVLRIERYLRRYTEEGA